MNRSNKPTSWQIKKTVVIKVDDKPVEVNNLPPEIQFEIETFDRFRADYLENLYKQEVLHQALNGKLNEIRSMIRAANAPKQQTEGVPQNDSIKE